MSLSDRVRDASRAALNNTRRNRPTALDDLKDELYRRISSEEIAQLIEQNAYRAKNEIRSVCTQIFEGAQWGEYTFQQREALLVELLNMVFGLGPIEELLNDHAVTEIMVNGTHSVYFEKEGILYKSEQVFSNDEQVRSLIDRIIGPLGRRIDEASPMVNARLPEGHRVNAIVPPLALDGPILTVRKFREHIFTLDELVELGSTEKCVAQFLVWAVSWRKNMAVSGGTGSGKTTLLNALSCEISKKERIITIEDSAELKFSHHPHVIRLEARPASAEGTGEVPIRELVINALRMRPDRIIVGECRGGEALDMLQAMNTGHDGSLTTLHANTPQDAVMRLTTLVRYVAELPVSVIETQIASALNYIIQTARAVNGHRYIQEVVELTCGKEPHMCEVRTIYRYDEPTQEGYWCHIPEWVDKLQSHSYEYRQEVETWKQHITMKLQHA